MPSVLVRFDAELRLVDDEVPEKLNYAEIQQAVQNVIGCTGTVVLDVTEYEEQSSRGQPDQAKRVPVHVTAPLLRRRD